MFGLDIQPLCYPISQQSKIQPGVVECLHYPYDRSGETHAKILPALHGAGLVHSIEHRAVDSMAPLGPSRSPTTDRTAGHAHTAKHVNRNKYRDCHTPPRLSQVRPQPQAQTPGYQPSTQLSSLMSPLCLPLTP